MNSIINDTSKMTQEINSNIRIIHVINGPITETITIRPIEEKDNKETRTLQANGGLTFKIIKGLTFRNNTGMRYQLYRRELFYGDQSIM